MKKLLTVLLLVFMVVGLVFAGGGTEAKATETKAADTWGLKPFESKQTLRVAFFTGSPLSYPILFADKLGVFEALNIDIQYTCFTGGPAMMEANASWDIGSCGLGGIALALAKYDNLRLFDVCDYEENMAIFVRADSAIAKDPGNAALWKGVTCVYPTGTTAQAVLAQYLQNIGLSLKDVVSVNADNSNALTVFNGGTGDVLVCWNAIALAADAAGHFRVTDSGQLKLPFPCASFVQKDFLAKNKELVATFTAVFHKAVEWLYASKENLNQGAEWYFEHCEEEGFLCTREVAQKTMEWYRGNTVAEYIDIFTKKSPDAAGLYTSRDLLQIEKDVMSGFDFFISEGKYTAEQRKTILDEKRITDEVALAVKDLVK
ncbi:MAG: ABC transporter substrate-binding protein [Spirochaetales bacterium]|nr:ABC transporter substrate-binding protein [Spirochaetales bacterium]